MSFDYDEIKSKEEGGSHWATYSDLFMVLSLVFLLLYVVASVRTGTSNIKSNAEYMAVVREKEALKEELIVYENQKDDYMNQANVKEIKAYDELMDKLSLLKEEAKQEKEDLRKAAAENERKEVALNKYQRMIRNIINSNMVAASNLNKRQKTIVKRNKTIDEQKEEIQDLESDVAQKKSEIKKGKATIKNLNASLSKKIRDLKKARKQKKLTKKSMDRKIQALKQANAKKVQKLKESNREASREIAKNQKIIDQVNQELAKAERKIASQADALEQMQNEQQQTFEQMAEMKGAFEKKMELEKAAFDQQMAKAKLSAKAKAEKQAEFLKQAQAKEAELAQEIQKMESKVMGIQGELDKSQQAQADAEARSKSLAATNKNLKGEKSKLSSEVKRLKELADAKKKLIGQMKRNFAKAGLKADVNKNGEVVIEFGEEYFDTGRADIKPGMEQVMKKFMPTYAQTLFSDPKTAQKIKSIDIVGYASPTYKGRYVDPESLDKQNKAAVNYNLSLSFDRAKSIFNYIYDTDNMKFPYQKKIRSMTEVTGRSFLAEGANKRAMANMSVKEYCKKHDCKKSQRVVIKFNMKN